MLRALRLVLLLPLLCGLISASIFVSIFFHLSADVYALQSGGQFTTKLNVVPPETNAPTIPTGLAATALSTSEIDLTWLPSTDDSGIAGYQVFRNGVAIGTTTQTSYPDVGLTVATTYSYTVQAFDSFFNYSAESSIVTATTLSSPPPPLPPSTPPPNTGGNGPPPANGPRIYNLQIQIGTTSARIHWTTDTPTLSTVSWGSGVNETLGQTHEITPSTVHETVIGPLKPDTEYSFRLTVQSSDGAHTDLGSQQFRTLALPDTEPPANITHVTATIKDGTIVLQWRNPIGSDFSAVRIIRSDRFYPSDIFDGALLYEGSKNTFTDREVAIGTVYYYSLFTKDKSGNYSSGAVIADVVPYPFPEGSSTPYQIPPSIPSNPTDSIPYVPDNTPNSPLNNLYFENIEFWQGNTALINENDIVRVTSSDPVSVRLDAAKVPKYVKAVFLVLSDANSGKNGSKYHSAFLLRPTGDKKYFAAILGPLDDVGQYAAQVSFINFKDQNIKQLHGIILSIMVPVNATESTAAARERDLYFLVFVEALGALCLALLLARKSKENRIKNSGP